MSDDIFNDIGGVALEESEELKQSIAIQKVCSDTLRALGYEVSSVNKRNEGIDLSVKGSKGAYTLAVTYGEPSSETHFRVPVAVKDMDEPHIFNMKADCIAFVQERHGNGTIFQFQLKQLRELVQPIVTKLKERMAINFYAHNAIVNKRLHACYNEEKSGYIFYLYLPIEAVCKQLKHSKNIIG